MTHRGARLQCTMIGRHRRERSLSPCLDILPLPSPTPTPQLLLGPRVSERRWAAWAGNNHCRCRRSNMGLDVTVSARRGNGWGRDDRPLCGLSGAKKEAEVGDLTGRRAAALVARVRFSSPDAYDSLDLSQGLWWDVPSKTANQPPSSM